MKLLLGLEQLQITFQTQTTATFYNGLQMVAVFFVMEFVAVWKTQPSELIHFLSVNSAKDST